MLQTCPLNFRAEYVCVVMSNIILVVWNYVLRWFNYVCVSPRTITPFVRICFNVGAKPNFWTILISLMFLFKITSYFLFQSHFQYVSTEKKTSHAASPTTCLWGSGVEKYIMYLFLASVFQNFKYATLPKFWGKQRLVTVGTMHYARRFL